MKKLDLLNTIEKDYNIKKFDMLKILKKINLNNEIFTKHEIKFIFDNIKNLDKIKFSEELEEIYSLQKLNSNVNQKNLFWNYIQIYYPLSFQKIIDFYPERLLISAEDLNKFFQSNGIIFLEFQLHETFKILEIRLLQNKIKISKNIIESEKLEKLLQGLLL